MVRELKLELTSITKRNEKSLKGSVQKENLIKIYKVSLHLKKGCLTGAYQKLIPLRYGNYNITNVVEDNELELIISRFLCMHPTFNVDYLQPYFPPLLDTLEIAEQLTTTELNREYMEEAIIDHIMDT